MKRLLCNGYEVDLAEKTKVQIKQLNPLFCFDDLACERTSNVELPDTANNDSLFGFAKLPYWRSQAFRRYFDCIFTDGIVEKTGYLYLTGYKNEAYQAVMVFGDFVDLKKIKDAGKLATYLQDALLYVEKMEYYATAGYPYQNLRVLKYEKFQQAQGMPCWCFGELLKEALDMFGIEYSLPAVVEDLRILKNSFDATEIECTFTNKRSSVAHPTKNSLAASDYNSLAVLGGGDVLVDVKPMQMQCTSFVGWQSKSAGVGGEGLALLVEQGEPEPEAEGRGFTEWFYKTYYFEAKEDFTLKFNNDMPDDLFMLNLNDDPATYPDRKYRPVGYTKMPQQPPEHWRDDFENWAGMDRTVYYRFFGGYSFEKVQQNETDATGYGKIWPDLDPRFDNVTGVADNVVPAVVTGEPLKGRTLQIRKGNRFMFVRAEDYCMAVCYGSEWGYYIGFYPHEVRTRRYWYAAEGVLDNFQPRFRNYEIGAVISREVEEDENGWTVVRRDQLPDVTAIDLLKTTASLTGLQLCYSKKKGITFEALNGNDFTLIDINGKVIKKTDISGKYRDFARRNVVSYKEDEMTEKCEMISTEYLSDVDWLESEKELYTLPFACLGEKAVTDMYGNVRKRAYLRNEKEADDLAKSDALLLAVTSDDYLQRKNFEKNTFLQNIAMEPITLNVQIMMSIYEYAQITPHTIFLFEGTRYVWTELNYDEGKVTASLVKVPEAIV